MSSPRAFFYTPDEYECEKASNSYLMALVVVMAGLPFPVVNLIASTIFYFSNRRSPSFVRWHCTQVLLAQAFTLPVNAVGVYWTIAILFHGHTITNNYIAYIITILLFNLVEFIAAMHAAIATRKGKHVTWWFFGPLTDVWVRQELNLSAETGV